MSFLQDVAEAGQITPAITIPIFPTQRAVTGVTFLSHRSSVDRPNIIAEIGSKDNKILKEVESFRPLIKVIREIPLTIGSDPEFLFPSGESYIPAEKFISDPGHNLRAGLDGYPHVGELRPTYGTPEEHIADLKDCISGLRNVPIRAKAGSGAYYGRPLGGHIHFNIPPQLQSVCALEAFVGYPLRRYSTRSIIGRFGRPFDIEVKPWGFEYRSLPSWISSPVLAEMVITAAWCIVNTSRKDHMFVPNQVGWETILEDNKKYLSILEVYKREVIDKPWTNFETDDLLAAWGLD